MCLTKGNEEMENSHKFHLPSQQLLSIRFKFNYWFWALHFLIETNEREKVAEFSPFPRLLFFCLLLATVDSKDVKWQSEHVDGKNLNECERRRGAMMRWGWREGRKRRERKNSIKIKKHKLWCWFCILLALIKLRWKTFLKKRVNCCCDDEDEDWSRDLNF